MAYKAPVMDAASVRHAYRRWAPIYDFTFGLVAEAGRKHAVRIINRRKGRVLEVGVGTRITAAIWGPASSRPTRPERGGDHLKSSLSTKRWNRVGSGVFAVRSASKRESRPRRRWRSAEMVRRASASSRRWQPRSGPLRAFGRTPTRWEGVSPHERTQSTLED